MLGLGLGLGGSSSSSSGPEMYYFFYGTLQHPDRLREVLGLPADAPLPESRPARVRRYRTSLWGQYPALVRSDQFNLVLQNQLPDPDDPTLAGQTDPIAVVGPTGNGNSTGASSASDQWQVSHDFDVVPGHVVRLNPELYEQKIQDYETANYRPQFVEVEILSSRPPTAVRPPLPRRKRPSIVRFEVPDLADNDSNPDDDEDGDVDEDEDEDAVNQSDQDQPDEQPPGGNRLVPSQSADSDAAGEWESDYAKTFVWVGDLSLLRPGRWSLVHWVEQHARTPRGGLRFV